VSVDQDIEASVAAIEVAPDFETPVQEPPQADPTPFEPPADPIPAEDIERLLPGPGEPFALEDGTMVIANELRLKEFLQLLKIVTRGAAIALGEVRLNTNDADFAQSLISLFIFAIPEAEDEAADFLRMMVRPAGPFPGKDEETAAKNHLNDLMENPDLEDMFSIIEIVITNDGKDLRRLGKRLTSALAFAQKTGQIS
jgi:hypothetical protein